VTEDEFIKTVDCRFPYDDEVRARELIKLGSAISPNAAFMVLHEICRPPCSSQVVISRVNVLLGEWIVAVRHPLVQEVLPVACWRRPKTDQRGCGPFLGLVYIVNPKLSRYSIGLR